MRPANNQLIKIYIVVQAKGDDCFLGPFESQYLTLIIVYVAKMVADLSMLWILQLESREIVTADDKTFS